MADSKNTNPDLQSKIAGLLFSADSGLRLQSRFKTTNEGELQSTLNEVEVGRTNLNWSADRPLVGFGLNYADLAGTTATGTTAETIDTDGSIVSKLAQVVDNNGTTVPRDNTRVAGPLRHSFLKWFDGHATSKGLHEYSPLQGFGQFDKLVQSCDPNSYYNPLNYVPVWKSKTYFKPKMSSPLETKVDNATIYIHNYKAGDANSTYDPEQKVKAFNVLVANAPRQLLNGRDDAKFVMSSTANAIEAMAQDVKAPGMTPDILQKSLLRLQAVFKDKTVNGAIEEIQSRLDATKADGTPVTTNTRPLLIKIKTELEAIKKGDFRLGDTELSTVLSDSSAQKSTGPYTFMLMDPNFAVGELCHIATNDKADGVELREQTVKTLRGLVAKADDMFKVQTVALDPNDFDTDGTPGLSSEEVAAFNETVDNVTIPGVDLTTLQGNAADPKIAPFAAAKTASVAKPGMPSDVEINTALQKVTQAYGFDALKKLTSEDIGRLKSCAASEEVSTLCPNLKVLPDVKEADAKASLATLLKLDAAVIQDKIGKLDPLEMAFSKLKLGKLDSLTDVQRIIINNLFDPKSDLDTYFSKDGTVKPGYPVLGTLARQDIDLLAPQKDKITGFLKSALDPQGLKPLLDKNQPVAQQLFAYCQNPDEFLKKIGPKGQMPSTAVNTPNAPASASVATSPAPIDVAPMAPLYTGYSTTHTNLMSSVSSPFSGGSVGLSQNTNFSGYSFSGFSSSHASASSMSYSGGYSNHSGANYYSMMSTPVFIG